MNKQELIKKYKELENGTFDIGALVDCQSILKDLEQLDEPEKPVVPQFVADYIEFQKKYNFHVYGAMRVIEDHYDKRVPEWFYDGNIEKFCLAWILGYEVEKEPKYTVKIKATKHYFAKDGNGRIYFSLKYESAFTKIELEKANLGWVFDCEGIEIEEVME